MRIKGSFTLESSIIFPLFTVITVAFILFALFMHDKIIITNGLFEAAVIIEDKSEADANDVVYSTKDYIKDKTIIEKDINVKLTMADGETFISHSGRFLALKGYLKKRYYIRKCSVSKENDIRTIRITRFCTKVIKDIINI